MLQYCNIVPSLSRARLSYRRLNMVLDSPLFALQEVKCFIRTQVSSWSLKLQFFSESSVQSLLVFHTFVYDFFAAKWRELVSRLQVPEKKKKKKKWMENRKRHWTLSRAATSLKIIWSMQSFVQYLNFSIHKFFKIQFLRKLFVIRYPK